MHPELNFDAGSNGGHTDGLLAWRKQREEARLALARKLGLPLGQQVEVWLVGNIRLRGRLHLGEEQLFLPADGKECDRFAVDNVSFRISEMESCKRI
jgi:hypothetical protein